MIARSLCFFSPLLLSISASAVKPPPHESLFLMLGGWPTIVAGVIGVVVAIPITRYFTIWGVQYAERRSAERAADQEKAQGEKEAEAERAKNRIEAEKRSNPHWNAAATLLRGALFARLPDAYRAPLIDRIVARFETNSQTTEQLFRTTRLFVEACLLERAQWSRLAISADTSAHAIFVRLSPLMGVAMRPGAADIVELETCNKLDALEDSEPKASVYFKTLTVVEQTYANAGIRIDETDRFLTRIRVNDGFVAPMYLIGGMLDQFGGDWQNALSHFNDALGQHPVLSVSIRRFELFRWLLWGASIPVCTCKRWEGAFKVLQYGYGDESNSFPLVLDRDIYEREWKRIREELNRFGERLPLAFGSGFEGSIVWGPQYHLRLGDFTNVFTVKTTKEHEQPIRLTYERERPRRSVFDGLMLRAEKLGSLSVRRRYYSAHAWILFEVVGQNGEPLYSKPTDRWRVLFPLFEEANMADGEALIYFKQRLAEKASKAIRDFEADCVGYRRLRYICAFDDPGNVVVDGVDGEDIHEFELTRQPEHAPTFRNGRRILTTLPVGKHRLRSLLANELDDPATVERVFSRPAASAEIITSCDLPEIVEAFYREYLNAPLQPLVTVP